MTPADIFLCVAAAFAGGAVNSVAGGGTFITFPLLILNGLTPLSANVMSTITLWPGSVASAFAYRKEQRIDKKQSINLILASVVGSVIGTSILLLAPEKVFEALVPWLLLFATMLLAFGGRIKIPGIAKSQNITRLGYALQFMIGIYGGYFGAGIGILMLATLQLAGFSHMHQMNALKTILGSAINAVAVMIFIAAGKVVWSLAAFMVAGGIAGGYVGAKLALKIVPQKVRRIVVAISFCMTAYFFAHRF